MAAKNAKKGSAQNVVVWILLGLLIVGLAGFGVDGILSQRVTTIGSVGSREITAQTYGRELQQTIRQLERERGQPLPLAQAQAQGIDAQVRARLITQAALESEAARIGVSVGDATVSRTISTIPGFQGPGGAFSRETYRMMLEAEGLTPARFEEDVRREQARSILQAATAAGVAVPANLRAALVDHFAARRDVTVFVLDQSALDSPLPDPDPAAVEAYWQANLARFTAPETRTIGYALLTPESLIDSIEVDEAALRALYDSRDEFRRPERRLVERLVLPDQATAEAAMARLADGTSFEDLVAERGLSLDDLDLGDVTQAQLGAAGEAVFALEEPGQVTGPHRTNLGPALFRMNAILNAQVTPFEDVAADLRAELALDRARRQIADRYDEIEDLLAGGATLDDLARDAGMTVGEIAWTPLSSDGIAAYAEFRAAAAAARPGDFPQLRSLSDGGAFVIELRGITPPTPRPLDEVRIQAFAGARAQALEAALVARATDLAPALAADGPEAFAEATGLVADGYAELTRLDGAQNLPEALVEAIHAAGAGETVVVGSGGQAFLALITAASPPDPGDEQTARLIAAIDQQIGGTMAQDVFGYFARALEREAGITLNQAAIDAVHATFR
jgi:peptidyl-prolyl cis-trans isomerase D